MKMTPKVAFAESKWSYVISNLFMAVNINEEDISDVGTLTQSVQGIQEDSPGVRHTDRYRRKWPFCFFGSSSIVIILA